MRPKSKPRSQPTKAPRGGARSEIAEIVLQDILHGRLVPGQRLVTETLAQRFQVSHTPIREAISTLAGMGVVLCVANRGAVVRKLTTREVREICQFRRVLECEAVKRCIGRIEPRTLHRLRGIFDRLAIGAHPPTARDLRIAKEADTQLHQVIRDGASNRFLASELDRLMTLITVIRDVAWDRLVAEGTLDRVTDESKQHRDIVDAILAEDPKKASLAMSRHLRSGMKSIVRAIE